MRRFTVLFCLIGALSIASGAFASVGGDQRVVVISTGALRGAVAGGVAGFEGVPFAAAPVGELRWREPQSVRRWSGIRDALAFGAPCAQAAFDWNRNIAARSSEDCLYLNVWMPAYPRKSQPLPVMVFFPGGAYHGGSAAGSSMIEPSYDGSRLARRGVVVVSANYRLGMFGFLSHRELTAESPHHVSGNYALMDKIAALKWIQANIAFFGGDPRNVTAMGQSAGSASIGYLMTSPLARGLFAKAIFHSNTVVDEYVGERTLKTAEADGAKFADGLLQGSSGGIATLRHRTAQALLETMMAHPELRRAEPRSVVVDGYVFPEQPAVVFQEGREAAIPLIVGNTSRDGDFASMGVMGTPKAKAAASNLARPLARTHKVVALDVNGSKAVQEYYGPYPDLASAAAILYADAKSVDPKDGDVVTAFRTDYIMRCGASLIGAWHARIAPTWRFEFSHGYEPLGAVHIWDLMYLFGWLQPPADQPRDVRLSDQLQRYWINFARNGDPNGVGLPSWPGSRDDRYLDFASDGAVVDVGPRSTACGLFARKTERDLEALRTESRLR